MSSVILRINTNFIIDGCIRPHLDFIRDHANAIMKASPVEYVRDAQLRGGLFDPKETNGAVSSVYTEFFVDHAEPLQALESVRKCMEWPLGDLLEGYEFLCILNRPKESTPPSASLLELDITQ